MKTTALALFAVVLCGCLDNPPCDWLEAKTWSTRLTELDGGSCGGRLAHEGELPVRDRGAGDCRIESAIFCADRCELKSVEVCTYESGAVKTLSWQLSQVASDEVEGILDYSIHALGISCRSRYAIEAFRL
jgi:hypothetical protein